jgi:predicted DNA-binding transcriptional regulator AlpA
MGKPMSPEVQHDALMSTAESAEFLGVSVWWLVKARGNKNGPKFVKIGRSVRYSRNSLLEFIVSNTRP